MTGLAGYFRLEILYAKPAASAEVDTFAEALEHDSYAAGAFIVEQAVPIDVVWAGDSMSVLGAPPPTSTYRHREEDLSSLSWLRGTPPPRILEPSLPCYLLPRHRLNPRVS